METQQDFNYQRIAKAIDFLNANYKAQPSLEEVAAHVNISPFHFQRMFKEWAGVTPKEFVQYLSIGHAKSVLKERNSSLLEAAYDAGLSGPARLHDLFIKIEGMTPGEYKNGGENLNINYSFAETLFGTIIVASTTKGICYMAFADEGEAAAMDELKKLFPKSVYRNYMDTIQQNALYIFTQDWSRLPEIKLHLKGSPFQLKVWETLLKIPMGKLATYADIAASIERTGASRAVGTSIGDNPVAFLIPCHRVIRSTGELGGYHWGLNRKSAMIGWEASRALVR